MAVKSAVTSWASGNMAGNPSLSRYGQSNRSGIAYSDVNAEFHSVQSHNSSGNALGTGGTYQLSASQLDGNNTRANPGAAVLTKGTAVQPYHQGTSTSDSGSSGSATNLGQVSQSASNVNLGAFRGTSARLPFRPADNMIMTWTGNIASQNSNNNATSRDIFSHNTGHGGVGATNGGRGYISNMNTGAFQRNTVTTKNLSTVAAAGDIIVVLMVCLGNGTISAPTFKNSAGNATSATQYTNALFGTFFNTSTYQTAAACTYAAWVYTAAGGETQYTTAAYAGTSAGNLVRYFSYVVGNGYTPHYGHNIGYQQPGNTTNSTWSVATASGLSIFGTVTQGNGQIAVFVNLSPYVGFYPTTNMTISSQPSDLAVKTNSTNQTTNNYGSTFSNVCMNQSGSVTTTTPGYLGKPATTNTLPIVPSIMLAQSPNHSQNLNFLMYFIPPSAGYIT